MRHLLLLVFFSGILGSMVGCCGTREYGGHAINDHGICDCEDENHCATRAPWLLQSPTNLPPVTETVPAPLPKGR